MGRGVGEFKKTLRPLRKSWDSVGFILLVADGLLWYMSVPGAFLGFCEIRGLAQASHSDACAREKLRSQRVRKYAFFLMLF